MHDTSTQHAYHTITHTFPSETHMLYGKKYPLRGLSARKKYPLWDYFSSWYSIKSHEIVDFPAICVKKIPPTGLFSRLPSEKNTPYEQIFGEYCNLFSHFSSQLVEIDFKFVDAASSNRAQNISI